MISKYRPHALIYAFSHAPAVCDRMNLYWGVHPILRPQARSAEHMVSLAEQELVRQEILKAGDVLGVVAGTQLASGSTNFMRLHVVTAEEVRQPAGRNRRRSNGKLNGKKR
jgi:pyruvate kinase